MVIYSAYETMSELFADMEEDVMALTLWHRVLKWIERFVTALYDVLGLSVSEIGQLIVNSYIEPPFKHAQLEKNLPRTEWRGGETYYYSKGRVQKP